MSTARILLAGAIDYAGMFPPAALPMDTAVANYAEYATGEAAWALGRFVVDSARLDEFDAAAKAYHVAWRVTAIGDVPVARAYVEAIEVAVPSPAGIRRSQDGLPRYYEIPIEPEPAEFVDAIARAGARAKVRTGGLHGAAFPAPAKLVRFLELCARSHVPFKATAGLHHPLRGENRLGSGGNGPLATMHGFVNVLLAAAFLRAGMENEQAVTLLEERDADAFLFAEDKVSWRDHVLTSGQLAAARQEFAIGFGSCSFEEPVNEIREIGLLP